MPLVAAMTVFMLAGGIALIVTGWRGTRVHSDAVGASREVDRPTLIRIGVSVAFALIAFAVTRWFGLAITVAGVIFMMWGMFVDRAARAQERDRLRAMMTWLEMLRDSVATGSGIIKAITTTSGRAPAHIAPQVRLLSARLDSMRLETALWRFGDDLDMAAADTAIAALVIATRHHGGNLTRLLSGVIESTRERVGQQARVEAMRAQFTTASVLMVVITSITAVMIVGGSKQFRSVYNSVVGQLVIVMVGLLFVGAIWVLRRMGRPRQKIRLTGGEQSW